MNQNNQFPRKDIPHCLTPVNLNINPNTKGINYNISNVDNNNNLINSNLNFSNNFIKESEYTIDNNSDINFYLNSSLKDQILSPGDDDLYLYLNYNTQNQNIYPTHKNKIDNNNNNLYNNNNKQNYNNDYESNYYLNFDINTTNFKSIENNNKKTLILDLDETLVHSSSHPLYYNGVLIQPDIFYTILFENKTHDVYVLKRPYIKEFLNKMSKIFNIYIFTASIKEYAGPLLFKLDNNKLISKKMFRESCTLSKDNKYIKDLHILNENLKNVILIDNNPNSYRYNKCNGIPIKTWHFDKSDKELIKIIPFLTFLALVEDVREYIPKVVDDDQLNYNKVKNIMNNSTINNIIKKDSINKNKRIVNKVKHKNKSNNSYNNSNINNNSDSIGKLKYYPSYTINEDSKLNNTGNKNRNNDNNINNNINKNIHNNINNNINNNNINNNINNNNINNNNNIENNDNLFYSSNINYNNNLEEGNNNNYNTVLNNRKNNHISGTINFREPITHFQSSIYAGNKNKINNNNNMIISNGNININQVNKNDENDNNQYQRSKISNNFNELTSTIHKFSSINFNLVNSQSNNKKIKYSVDLKNQKYANSNSNEIHKIYENKNMTEKCLSYNNLMNNRVNISKIENSLYLDNNDPILVTYIQNNNINFNTNNNIMSINLKDDKSSNKNILYKEMKENKTQRNYHTHNHNNKINKYRSTTNNNLFRNKNILYKNRVNDKASIAKKNNDNSKENRKNDNYEDTMDNIEHKKYYNVRNKKIKRIKSTGYRNYDYNYNKNNYNKKSIPISKTNDYKRQHINNNNLDNYDSIYYINNDNLNINNINKKVRSQTLNGQPASNHRLYSKFEENKNCTMEISKNIKKKIYNNRLKDNNNYKDYNHKYNNIKNKNATINYNTSKQKNRYRKNDLNNEMNLLNEFMKDFNKEQKEISYLSNYQNITKEINSQRLQKIDIRKKNITSLINFNNNNDKSKDKKMEEEKEKIKNELFCNKNIEQNDKENFYNFYNRKNKPYIISKETNNYIKKKMKNINLEDYYTNEIKNNNNNNDNE